MCAPPDFADLLARVGVPMVRTGRSVRALVHGDKQAKPSTPADAPRVAAELVAAQFESLGPAAEGCDALVATGLMPAGARTVAEERGIPYVLVSFTPPVLPSPHFIAAAAAGPAVSAGRDRQPRVVGGGCRAGAGTVRRSAQYPPRGAGPAAGRKCPRPRLHRPPVAGGGRHPGPMAWFAGSRCRADRRVDPARRTPTPGRLGGVPGRRHTTGVRGFQQRARPERTSPGWPSRRSVRRAVAPSSPAAGPTWL